jgi:hypothetical protein
LTEAHDTARWAEVVVSFVDAPRDAKNLLEFGLQVGIAVGTFRTWCRAASLSPRQSLQFARALRAVMRQEGEAPPLRLLNIVDPRTLARFLFMAGGTQDKLPTSVDEFLRRQRYIEDAAAVNAVESRLASRRTTQ